MKRKEKKRIEKKGEDENISASLKILSVAAPQSISDGIPRLGT